MARELALASTWVVIASSAQAAMLRVELDGSGDFRDIQAAADAARDGDTVLVGPGEHLLSEPLDFNRLRGPGKPPRNLIVRSTAGPATTTLRLGPTSVDPDRASVVIFDSGESSTSRLEGFRITGGRGTRLPDEAGDLARRRVGGGVLCRGDVSPQILDCEIVEHDVRWGPWFDGGGGVACIGGAPRIERCTIRGNRIPGDAGQGGAGVLAWRSRAVFRWCRFSRNGDPNQRGSGAFVTESACLFDGCRFEENRGRSVDFVDDTASRLERCTLARNDEGLGMHRSSPTLVACRITGNLLRGVCRGASWDTVPGALLVDCLIAGNGHGLDGAGWTVVGCTIAENRWSGVRLGGGRLTNCVVWGNGGQGLSVPTNLLRSLGEPDVSWSIVEGDAPWPGEGNSDADPLFVLSGRWEAGGSPDDRADDTWIDGDYHLRPGSPAIDSGTARGARPVDLEGNPRPCGGGVDRGAFELPVGECCFGEPLFRRGDANADLRCDITDAVLVLRHLFLGGPPLGCRDAADADDSGTLDIHDALRILGWLFARGRPPASPFEATGTDPTDDALGCVLPHGPG